VFVGQIERGWQALREVRELWREQNNLPMLADSLSNSALTSFYLGRFDEAIQCAEEALQLSRSIANRWGQSHASGMLGYTLHEVGRLGEAAERWESSVALGAESGLVSTQMGIRADLAWLYGSVGALERGIEHARAADAHSAKVFLLWRPWTAAVLARLLMLVGDFDEAGRALEEGLNQMTQDYFTRLLLSGAAAVALAQGELALAGGDYTRAVDRADELAHHLQSFGARPFISDALLLKGRALRAAERLDEAAAALNEARSRAESLGSRRGL